MTEIVATKDHPAPLDAFETAKPNEPIWTVQGGDPLGPPLLRIWAWLARIRAGIINPNAPDSETVVLKAVEMALDHSLEHDEKEANNILIRATATEKISWSMDDYAKGQLKAAQPTEAADTHLDELQRIDLHDLRVRVAQKLSNFRCEILEMVEALEKAGYDDPETIELLRNDTQLLLRDANSAVEPRRLFTKDR